MSDHKCRMPGCTVKTQTREAIKLHEQQFHDYTPLSSMPKFTSTTKKCNGLYFLNVLFTQQIALVHNEIFIQKTLNLDTSS